MIKALLFDFDGLILDTENAEFHSWQEMYVEHGVELRLSEWAQCIGRGSDDVRFDPYERLEELISRPVDREEIRVRRKKRNLELIGAMDPRPGVVEQIDAARSLGLSLGVASSSRREWVFGHLARLGLLSCFDTVRCADDVERAKPFPDLYLLALEDFGLHSDEAVVFEDSPNGVRAAVDAGVYTVWVPNDVTRSLPCFGYDLRLDSLADLDLEDLIEEVSEPLAIAL